MKLKIVALDGYTLNPGDNPWKEIEQLGEFTVYDRTCSEDFLARADTADVILTNKTPITRQQLDKLPDLKFISVLATGYNVVDTVAACERGIPVSNVPAYGTDSVAQHTLALILELCNHVGDHALSTAAGEWSRCPDFCYWKKPIRELRGLTLGLIGFGNIGQEVARLGHAFGMKIIYANRSVKNGISFPAKYVSIEELIQKADVISLHCSQTSENFQFVNKELLSRAKPSAFLVNTSRGGLIQEEDLAQALRDGIIAGTALDVLSKEPPDASNPLLRAPNCLVTPHIAWSGIVARQRLVRSTADNIRAFIAGNPINVVNGRI
jgi:glycerate dehydrogenase